VSSTTPSPSTRPPTAGLAIRQVAGERFVHDIDDVDSEGASGEGGLIHQVVGYEPDMPSVYAGADLLIGRGGASTVHEVAATGVPSILVPWSGAADDHQTANVRWLSDVGGTILLPESEVEARLCDEIERLRSDAEARDSLAESASQRGEVHRSGALAELIERVALASSTR
jgi:UDP-N-acetylglucosamine--N-acetylmuramyl-(pentapeptide) pyrophosphoryl-undecaprenol N-acetylglucosamine transferase